MWLMILPLISDDDFPVSELGDLVDLTFGIDLFLWFVVWVILMILITVRSRAVLICDAHVDVAGVFAGPASIWGYAASPALAIAGG